MPCDVDVKKRALVTLLKRLARKYKLNLDLVREASDAQVLAAFRRVIRWAHPDKSGSEDDTKDLNLARDQWEGAKQNRRGPGRQPRPPHAAPQSNSEDAGPLAENVPGKRIHAQAVMLTFQGVVDLQQWQRFLDFWKANMKKWCVKYWCATLESNQQQGYHIHAMTQFKTKRDCHSKGFTFEGLAPNTEANDLLQQGWCRKKMQESIDRGMFYCFAHKTSSVFNEGKQCMDGNYQPCWTSSVCNYKVKGVWPEDLWKARKVSSEVYSEYLYLCRDGTPGRKRNYETVLQWEENKAMRATVEERVARFRADPNLCPPFPSVPAATTWLEKFKTDLVRYPILIAVGPSDTGKTEWAHTLFSNALELKIGTLQHFPEIMRTFCRTSHDGVILDDLRDLDFLSNNQEKIQGKYNGMIEFASTPGGHLAYWKDLFGVPIVATCNHSTKNLSYLQDHDWLGKPANRVVVKFPLA